MNWIIGMNNHGIKSITNASMVVCLLSAAVCILSVFVLFEPTVISDFSIEKSLTIGDIISSLSLFITILIFLVTVRLEKNKTIAENKQKLDAVKFFLNEELKLNYWSYKTQVELYETLIRLQDMTTPLIKVEPGIEDTVLFKYFDGEETDNKFESDDLDILSEESEILWSCFAVKSFTNTRYESMAYEIAELGLNFARKLENFYSELAEYEFFKNEVISYIKDTTIFDGINRAFVRDLLKDDMPYLLKRMNGMSELLTGHSLQKHRLR